MTNQNAGNPPPAALALADPRMTAVRAPVAVGVRGVQVSTTVDVWAIAEWQAVGLGQLRRGMDAVEQRQTIARIASRIVTGLEAGLPPSTAARGLYEVNGRVAWYAETLRGLLFSRGVVPLDDEDAINIYIENEPEPDVPRREWPASVAGVASIRRTGWKKPKVVRFTVGDARTAKLWDKAGPWQEYPKRMLQERAFAYWCRDYAPDVTMNLPIVSEALDMDAAPVREAPPALMSAQADAVEPGGPSIFSMIDAEPVEAEPVEERGESDDGQAPEPEPEPEREELSGEELAGLRDALAADVERRAGAEARADLLRELGPINSQADYDAALAKLRQHRIFGDTQPIAPGLFDGQGTNAPRRRR